MSRIVLAGRSSIPTTDLDAMFSELYPYKGCWPMILRAGAYTVVASDVGGMVVAGGNVTLPSAVISTAGQYVVIYNNTGASISLIQGSGLTLRLGGTSTLGDRTLATRGVAFVLYLNGGEAVVFGGAGVS